jgi:hypothetical protein
MLKSPRHPVKADCHSPHVAFGRFAGGGAASNMTKVFGRGISSVTYNAATGCYRITFNAVPAGTFLGVHISCAPSAGTAAGMRIANETGGTYSATNKIVDFTVCDTATPTLTDLATTDYVTITAMWAETAKP